MMHAAFSKPLCCSDRRFVGPGSSPEQSKTESRPQSHLLGRRSRTSKPASQVRAGLQDCRHLPHRKTTSKRAVVLSMAAPDSAGSKPKVAFLGIGIMGLGMVRSGLSQEAAESCMILILAHHQIIWVVCWYLRLMQNCASPDACNIPAVNHRLGGC